MKIPDRNPVCFDSESRFNVCAAGRVDRRTARSSSHPLHLSSAMRSRRCRMEADRPAIYRPRKARR
jgi:hypothetical protein